MECNSKMVFREVIRGILLILLTYLSLELLYFGLPPMLALTEPISLILAFVYGLGVLVIVSVFWMQIREIVSSIFKDSNLWYISGLAYVIVGIILYALMWWIVPELVGYYPVLF